MPFLTQVCLRIAVIYPQKVSHKICIKTKVSQRHEKVIGEQQNIKCSKTQALENFISAKFHVPTTENYGQNAKHYGMTMEFCLFGSAMGP